MSSDNKLKLKTYQAFSYTLKSYVYIQGPTTDKTFRQNLKSVSQHTSEKSQSIRTKNSTMTSFHKSKTNMYKYDNTQYFIASQIFTI